MRPHNLPLVMLGAGLLWFGWFGFNAGSALGNADGVGARRVRQHPGRHRRRACSAGSSYEKIRARHVHHAGRRLRRGRRSGRHHPGLRRRSRPLGAHRRRRHRRCRCCAMAVGLKYKFGYDDSLDVVGVHLVGGVVGSLLIGFFATGRAQSDGRAACSTAAASTSCGKQAVGVGRACSPTPWSSPRSSPSSSTRRSASRVTEDDEVTGIDQAEHAETAYDFSRRRRRRGARDRRVPRRRRRRARRWTHEAHHRGRQAAPARRGQGRPAGLRRRTA